MPKQMKPLQLVPVSKGVYELPGRCRVEQRARDSWVILWYRQAHDPVSTPEVDESDISYRTLRAARSAVAAVFGYPRVPSKRSIRIERHIDRQHEIARLQEWLKRYRQRERNAAAQAAEVENTLLRMGAAPKYNG